MHIYYVTSRDTFLRRLSFLLEMLSGRWSACFIHVMRYINLHLLTQLVNHVMCLSSRHTKRRKHCSDRNVTDEATFVAENNVVPTGCTGGPSP